LPCVPAADLAVLVAWVTENTFATIAVGIAVFRGVRFLS
jgi:branched-subunit amino acid transport protein